MEKRNVKIGNDIYQLTAVTCDVSGAISIQLLSDFAPLLVAFLDKDFELLNKELRTSLEPNKIMRMLIDLINVNVLEKNASLVKDWKEEFQRKPLTLLRLGYEALRFNCEDFFTSMSGLVNEKLNGQNLNDLIKSLETEGVEIPAVLQLLLQNGELTSDENKK